MQSVLNNRTAEHSSPTHSWIARCHTVTVTQRRRLIDRGASTAGGATPLFLAAQNGQLAVAELLVDQGRADLDTTHRASVSSLAPYLSLGYSAEQHPSVPPSAYRAHADSTNLPRYSCQQ